MGYWSELWKSTVALTGKGRFMSGLLEEIKNNSWMKLKSRRVACSITRLRIGHAGVNNHSHRFNLSDTPLCQNCQELETIDHFILRCPVFQQQREVLKDLHSQFSNEFTLANYVLCFGHFVVSTLTKQLEALAVFLKETRCVSLL